MASRIRQNFKEESEALINKQINMEFYASYVYMSMYAYFDRDDQVVFFNFDIDIHNPGACPQISTSLTDSFKDLC